MAARPARACVCMYKHYYHTRSAGGDGGANGRNEVARGDKKRETDLKADHIQHTPAGRNAGRQKEKQAVKDVENEEKRGFIAWR